MNSPAVILYDASGVPLAVEQDAEIPANTKALLIAGDNGGDAKVVEVGNNGHLHTDSQSLLHAISLGEIPGKVPWAGHTKALLGSVTGVGRQLVDEGTWVDQSSGAQRSVKSNSANDAAVGTGARKILLQYISSVDGTAKTEIITLNGTTAVNTTATDIQYINGFTVVSAGSGGDTAGDIAVFTQVDGGGSPFAQILASRTTTHRSRFWVPSNMSLYVVAFELFIDSEAWFDLERTADYSSVGGANYTPDRFSHIYVDRKTAGMSASFPLPWVIGAGQRFSLYVVNGGNGNKVAAVAYGWME